MFTTQEGLGGAAARDEGRRGDLEFRTTPGLLELAVERFAARAAVCDGDVTLTYAALADAVLGATRGLLALGVARGDRVAIWAPNGWRWIVAALATHAAGAAVVPVNTRFKGEEAAYVLGRSGARVLFAVTDFLGVDFVAMLRGAAAALPALAHTIAVQGPAWAAVLDWEAFVRGGEVVAAPAAVARSREVSPDDLSDVIYTSGTTGAPKGVTCTHALTLRAFRDWADLVGLRAGDRYLVALPFFHTFGYKAGWLASLMVGATVFPQAVFDVDALLARVVRERITVLPGAPSLYQSILAHPNLAAFDLSSLRLAVTGAAVIPVELVERMRRELAFETVLTGYGLTEATGVSALCRAGDDAETVATTSGRAIPGVSMRAVDGEGRDVPPGEPGEILIAGYGVTRGYLDDPAATAAAIDADGWLHTGDVGVLDARGYVRITDRTKDMFIVGGFNTYPAEIERVLQRHPAIVQAAVVGAPDARLGEVAAAFVVLRAGASFEADELIAWSRERMANYKVPRSVVVVEALPMNATGKVLKHKLRERLRAQ